MVSICDSPEVVLMVCPDTGRILNCNDNSLWVYGYSREELLQMNIRDIRASQTLPYVEGQLEVAKKEGIIFETTHRRKDGSHFAAGVSSRLVEHEGKMVLHSLIRDISRQIAFDKVIRSRSKMLVSRKWDGATDSAVKKLEGHLQTKVFRGVFDHAGIGMSVMSLDGVILEANRSLCNLLGLSPQEIEGTHFAEHTHPEDLETDMHVFNLVIKERDPSYALEKRLLCRNGRIIWVHLTSSLICDDSGAPLFVVRMLQNMTPRKMAEQELHRAAAIIANTHDAIYTCSMDGTITSWNPAAEKLFGWSTLEAIGSSFWRMVPPNMFSRVNSLVNEALKGNRAGSIETTSLTNSGNVLDVSITISPLLTEEGTLSGWVSVVRDITEQKIIRSELARLDRLNVIAEMAAGVSHEVRNPMTTVRGYLQLFSTKPELANYSRQFGLMIEELDHINSIITEFLSIGINRQEKHSLYNLNSLVEELLPLLESESLQRGINLAFSMDAQDIVVEANGQEVRQLLLNLVRNGMEAMQTGGTLSVATELRGAKAILSVEDTGGGIPQHIVARIYDPFFSTKAKGVGLGLTVAYSIAKRHGAHLYIANTGPRGTRFEVAFPIL